MGVEWKEVRGSKNVGWLNNGRRRSEKVERKEVDDRKYGGVARWRSEMER